MTEMRRTRSYVPVGERSEVSLFSRPLLTSDIDAVEHPCDGLTEKLAIEPE